MDRKTCLDTACSMVNGERQGDYGLQNIISSPAVAYMSSPIGDLPIDSTGMRKAVDEIARLTEARRWIPVTERLPEDYAIVQIVEDNGYKWLPRIGEYRKCLDEWRIEGAFEHSNGWLEDTKMFKVTHWQPLPEPPTKGE